MSISIGYLMVSVYEVETCMYLATFQTLTEFWMSQINSGVKYRYLDKFLELQRPLEISV
jgi:hypothetical protein